MVNKSRTAPNYAHQRNYLPDLPDQLGAYDHAIACFLAQMRFDYATREDDERIEPLRVVKASPERAFADLRERFEETIDTGAAYTDFEKDQEQIALPIASFMRTDLMVDMTRFNPNDVRKVDYLTQDQSEAYTHKWPLPYNISYQVDFWTRYESTLDSIRVWLMMQFMGGNFRLTPVDFRDVSRFYGIKNVYTRFDGINDTSDLEPGTEPRIERATTTLEMQGWIFYPIEVVKTVLSGQVDVSIVPCTIPLDDAAALDDQYIVDTVTFDQEEE